jgi:hypothetical protein
MDIIVRKNRQGGLGQITCARDEHLRFVVSDPQQPSVETGRTDGLIVGAGDREHGR